MPHLSTILGKYEGLWSIDRATTRDCVYGLGSFAIHSLRFPLIAATGADFLVEIAAVGTKRLVGRSLARQSVVSC